MINHYLAQASVTSIVGQINAPTGIPSQVGDIGMVIGLLINIFLIVAGFFLLIYLMSGAFDWIISGGEKEKISKAQSKITNAVIGMILVVVMLSLWNVLAGQVLHITTIDKNGNISFPLPHF